MSLLLEDFLFLSLFQVHRQNPAVLNVSHCQEGFIQLEGEMDTFLLSFPHLQQLAVHAPEASGWVRHKSLPSSGKTTVMDFNPKQIKAYSATRHSNQPSIPGSCGQVCLQQKGSKKRCFSRRFRGIWLLLLIALVSDRVWKASHATPLRHHSVFLTAV